MKIIRNMLFAIMGAAAAVIVPAISSADIVRIHVQPNGKGSFFLTGENVIGVEALDVEIDYDAGLLKNPYPMVHGGQLRQAKFDTPGKLILGIFRPVADPILQIILNFDTDTDTPGGIYHVSAVARSTSKWPAESDLQGSPEPDSGNDGSSGEAEAAVSLPRSNKAGPGEIGARGKTASAPEMIARIESSPVARSAAAPTASVRKTSGEVSLLLHEEKNVLQRFMKYRGERTLASLTALFERGSGDRTTQEPWIALSDGKTPALITIPVPAGVSHPVGLGLSDARLLSREASAQEIVMTVLPIEGTWDARVIIVTGGQIIDYPLVVAPSAALPPGVTEQNFPTALQAFVQDQPQALQREDNRYVAEYIFISNYLAGQAGNKRN